MDVPGRSDRDPLEAEDVLELAADLDLAGEVPGVGPDVRDVVTGASRQRMTIRMKTPPKNSDTLLRLSRRQASR
jgi:hypothetical protein